MAKKAAQTMPDIYRLKVTLRGTDPPVWKRSLPREAGHAGEDCGIEKYEEMPDWMKGRFDLESSSAAAVSKQWKPLPESFSEGKQP